MDGGLATLALTVSGLFGTAVQADEASDDLAASATENSITLEGEIGTQAFPGCQLGWACVWAGKDYTSASAAASHDGVYTWTSDGGTAVLFQNSAAANGNLCYKTRFYNSDRTKFFVLNSQTRLGGTSRDPNLSNGAGNAGATTMNWTNKIRRFAFFNGPNCA